VGGHGGGGAVPARQCRRHESGLPPNLVGLGGALDDGGRVGPWLQHVRDQPMRLMEVPLLNIAPILILRLC
jgi:hypothetical protein